MCFFCGEEIYKSFKEGLCPFMLGFDINCKIVVFKDLGPDHWHRSRLSRNAWRESKT
jgi:hypothetical protein